MVDYTEKIQQLQRLVDIKKSIEPFASKEAIEEVTLNFNNVERDLIDNIRNEESQLEELHRVMNSIKEDMNAK